MWLVTTTKSLSSLNYMFKPFPVKGSRVERVVIDPAYTAIGRDFTLFIPPYCFATHNQ